MIKFRVWDSIHKMYVYPPNDIDEGEYVVDQSGNALYVLHDGMEECKEDKICLSFGKKDVKKWDVYIGDIVTHNMKFLVNPCVVIFDSITYEIGLLGYKSGYNKKIYKMGNFKLDIIGNTMENPDLITEDMTEGRYYNSFKWVPDPQYGLVRVRK